MTTTTSRDELDARAYAALLAHGGNATEAAQALGMPRTTFRTRITRYEAKIATSEEAADFTGDPAAVLKLAGEAEAAAGDAATGTEAPEPQAGDNGTGGDFEDATAGDDGTGEDEADDEDAEDEPAAAPVRKAKGTYKPKPADKQCACGCGELTARTFARGHDSRYASALRAAYKNGGKTRDEVLTIAGGISARFHGKLVKSLAQADKDGAPGTGTCPCCGEATARTFVRGHDSRYAKVLRARVAAGEMTRDEALAAAGAISERFHGKVTRALAKDAEAAGK